MEETLLNEFKQQLLKIQAEVKQELDAVANPDIGEHVPGDYAAKFPNFGDDNYLDPGSDTPGEVQEYQVNLSVTEQLEAYLKNVEAALLRIEDGTYGKDINTGEEISIERLKANPAAETAIPKPAAN